MLILSSVHRRLPSLVAFDHDCIILVSRRYFIAVDVVFESLGFYIRSTVHVCTACKFVRLKSSTVAWSPYLGR